MASQGILVDTNSTILIHGEAPQCF